MPKYEKYYVVEFRYPVRVEDTDGITHVVSKAARICERVHGFRPDNWFARIFEYDVGEGKPGVSKEYFYNPNSTNHREIKKNIGYHEDMVREGLSPEDISDYKFFEGEDEDSSDS
jgi:hypothetical protein